MEPTNITMPSIRMGNTAAELTATQRSTEGIAGRCVPWANLNYALSPPPVPSPWAAMPADPGLEARGWLSHMKIWPQDRPLPPGALWRTTSEWRRGTWPPPPGEELGLMMAPLREWINAIPHAPERPTVRYLVNFAHRRTQNGETTIRVRFMSRPTGRSEPRRPTFAVGLETRNPVCITEDPADALALGARGYRAVAVGDYAGHRKQGSAGEYAVSELLNLLTLISGGSIAVCRGPWTEDEGLERIVKELSIPPQAEITVKEIPEEWPEFPKRN